MHAVSVDGDTIVVGAYSADDGGTDSGAVYVFMRTTNGSWIQEAKLIASDAAANAWFGNSVSLNDDTAVVGAYGDDAISGSAYIFIRNAGGTWTQQAKLTAPDAAEEDSFGISVSVNGDTAVVGAFGDDAAGSDSGSAFVFARDARGNWSECAMLTASDAAARDHFGYSVSVDGDTAVVGAPRNGPGAAYVFTRNAEGAWNEHVKLTASDAGLGDNFGKSVAVNGGTAVVGSYLDDDGGRDSGSAYIFTRDSGGAWREQAKLTASDFEVDDKFGMSVSVNGDTVVIGAYGDDDNGSCSGSAYVFTRCTGGVWSEQAKLTAPDAREKDYFGISVSVSGDIAVVGGRASTANKVRPPCSTDSGAHDYADAVVQWQSKAPTCFAPNLHLHEQMADLERFVVGGTVTEPLKVEGPLPTQEWFEGVQIIPSAPVIELVINATGRVESVVSLRQSSEAFDTRLAQALREWRFQPSQLAGEPVCVRYALTVRIGLQ